MKAMRSALVPVILTLIALAAGCTQKEEVPPGPPHRVTLALATIPDTALAQVARSMGYFAAEGLEVTTRLHQYGKPALQEVLDGKADFATVAETPLMFAILAGKKPSVIATIMTSSSSNAIIARKDRGIATLQDLKGKTIAATLGTTSEYFLYSLLVTNGISMQDVRIVDLKAEAIPDALARGEADAASLFLPYSVLTQKILGANCTAFTDKNIYRESFNVVTSQEYVLKHPETVRRFLKALIRAEDFVRSNPAEAQRIVADTSGLRADVIREIWAESTMSATLDQTLMLSLEDETEWAIKNRLTRATRVPNYLEYIHLDGLRSLKPDAVRILK